MPSSASQAVGAARAHSRNVQRRKRQAAETAVGFALRGFIDDDRPVPPDRWRPIVDALAELSEPRLGQILHEAGLRATDYVRMPGGRWAQ